jgi:hypothetical protein
MPYHTNKKPMKSETKNSKKPMRKHMKNMTKFMKAGDSFIVAHNKAVKLDKK